MSQSHTECEGLRIFYDVFLVLSKNIKCIFLVLFPGMEKECDFPGFFYFVVVFLGECEFLRISLTLRAKNDSHSQLVSEREREKRQRRIEFNSFFFSLLIFVTPMSSFFILYFFYFIIFFFMKLTSSLIFN